MKKLLAGIILSLILAVPAVAAVKSPDKYIYDPAHTQIVFRVDHLGFSHPSGRFLKFSGGFVFDADTPENSDVNMIIQARSIDMGSSAWEDVMKGSSFLKTDKYPDITFKSTKIVKTGARTGNVTGDLTIIGVTKPITLAVTYNKSGTHPYNKNYIAGFSATGKIKRSDYGMDFGLPGIGDMVDIDVEVEGIRQDFGKLNTK